MKSAKVAILVFLSGCVCVWGQDQPLWVPVHKSSTITVLCLGEAERAELARRAKSGDVWAQDELGTQHVSECQGKNDAELGLELLTQAAAQGNAHAQLRLGELYQFGGPVKPNPKAAVAWLEKSAAQGYAPAQNNLGVIYLEGILTAKDEARAATLFLAAAEQDLPKAAYNAATLFDLGQGVVQDYAAARRWYQRAAERKDADAEYRLALLLEQGLGGPEDPVTAMRWMRRAAEDGSNNALVRLGFKSPAEADTVSSGYFQFKIAEAFFNGKGMAKDPAMALKFLEKSAQAGYPPAFLALGRMYARGDGVTRDEARAIGYLEAAIAKDPKSDMAYNVLAWTLITAEDTRLRNPKSALEYATKAIELSGGTQGYQLDTLAQALFQLGDVDGAVDAESKALLLQPDNDFYQKSLEQFKTAKSRPESVK